MKVSFILGAGFSFNAKMPLVKDISAKFLQRPLYKYTLYFGSGEWKWTEWACDADLHNGKIHALGLEISFFMELMIDRYLESVGEELLNYEEFYNYLLKVRYETPDQFNAYLHEAQARYEKEFQGSETIFTDIPDFFRFLKFVQSFWPVTKPTTSTFRFFVYN